MDDKTVNAYNDYAEEFCQRYRDGERIPIERICSALSGCEKLLEIGTGSGVDAVRLNQAGFQVTGLEPSLGLIANTLKHFPELLGSIHHGALPLDQDRCDQWHESFDAVFCSAVFMHIAPELRMECMGNVAHVLKPGGKLFMIVSEHREGLDDESRDEFGRLYHPIPETEVMELSQAHRFSLEQTWADDDRWHRRGLSWKSFLFEKTA